MWRWPSVHKVSRWISWTKAHLLLIVPLRIRFQLIHKFPIIQFPHLFPSDTMVFPAPDFQDEVANSESTNALQKLYPNTFDAKKYLYLPHGKYSFAAEQTIQGRIKKELSGCPLHSPVFLGTHHQIKSWTRSIPTLLHTSEPVPSPVTNLPVSGKRTFLVALSYGKI